MQQSMKLVEFNQINKEELHKGKYDESDWINNTSNMYIIDLLSSKIKE